MIKELIVFTNRNAAAYDENAKYVVVAEAISYSHIDKKKARLTIDNARECYLSQYGEWQHPIKKEVLKCLLGLHEDQDITTE